MADEKEDAKSIPEETSEGARVRKFKVEWRHRMRTAEQWTEPYTVNVAPGKTSVPGDERITIRGFSGLTFPFNNDVVYIGRTSAESEEHEKTLQLITDKLAALPQREDLINAKEEIIKELSGRIENLQLQLEMTAAELAKSKELEACTIRLCDQIRLESEETRKHMTEELSDLRTYLSKFAPHKRFFRVTFGFLCFFGVAQLLHSLFGIEIVKPFWGTVGAVLSAAMLIVIYFGMKDAQDVGKVQ